MFLSLMILMQSKLPCSENFYRYQKNYEQYLGQDKSGEGAKSPSGEGEIKTIASPRMMSKLSPINAFGKEQGINFNPDSQKVFLKLAAQGESGAARDADGDTGSVAVGNFKSNRTGQADKKQQAEDLAKMIAEGKDTVNFKDAIRLPNAAQKPKGMVLSTDPNAPTQQMIMSPTAYLMGAASPRFSSFVTSDDAPAIHMEGEMIRKATETKLKRYWYCLLGKELYVYKNKKEDKHKSMHSLVGVFIKDEPEEQLDSTTILYPFKLVFPPNKARAYYLLNKDEKEKWVEAIKKVVGYSNLFDFYEIKETLGKGKFGLVKSATHKKTGKKVAVKVMSKKEMTASDVELQRREIEILKMCQHPHIIRLLDIFENTDYIYIVMENLSGGDLFTYLEKRKFTISEKRAKELSH